MTAESSRDGCKLVLNSDVRARETSQKSSPRINVHSVWKRTPETTAVVTSCRIVTLVEVHVRWFIRTLAFEDEADRATPDLKIGKAWPKRRAFPALESGLAVGAPSAILDSGRYTGTGGEGSLVTNKAETGIGDSEHYPMLPGAMSTTTILLVSQHSFRGVPGSPVRLSGWKSDQT